MLKLRGLLILIYFTVSATAALANKPEMAKW